MEREREQLGWRRGSECSLKIAGVWRAVDHDRDEAPDRDTREQSEHGDERREDDDAREIRGGQCRSC